MQIWFVDDMASNHHTWLRSFPETLQQNHQFEVFATVEALFDAFKTTFPDILFIDYFIGPRTGAEVVEFLVDKTPRPLMIAHSSMADANRGMLKLGADVAFAKNPDMPMTQSILQKITCEADLVALLDYKKEAS